MKDGNQTDYQGITFLFFLEKPIVLNSRRVDMRLVANIFRIDFWVVKYNESYGTR